MPNTGLPAVTDCGGSTSAWHAISLRPNRQFRVREALRELAIEQYLPTCTEEVRWSDRRKSVEKPLFPGYIFARYHSNEWPTVAAVPGVVAAIGRVNDAELENFRRMLTAAAKVSPCPYEAGQQVTIAHGPFAGTTGVVIRTKNATRLVVAIEILRRAVSVQIDAADIEKTKTNK